MIEPLLYRAMERYRLVDDELGKAAFRDGATSNDDAAQALIAIATAHLMAARSILEIVGGPELVAAVLRQHADDPMTPRPGKCLIN